MNLLFQIQCFPALLFSPPRCDLCKTLIHRIVEHALAELRAGRTPSPDIFCNERIKFGVFMDRLGGAFDRVASGHYAQIAQCEEVFYLQRAMLRLQLRDAGCQH